MLKKTLVISSLVALSVAAGTAVASDDDITVNYYSAHNFNLAVGGNSETKVGYYAGNRTWGGGAYAGSVEVDVTGGQDGDIEVNFDQHGVHNIAIGDATAGSVRIGYAD